MSDDRTEQVEIPVEFIRSITGPEWTMLIENNGVLNAEQCARLWRMTDRQDPPPVSMKLLFSREDIMRIWPRPKSRRKGGRGGGLG